MKKSILVVDDQKAMGFIFKELFKDKYNVYIAYDKSSVMNLIREIQPDVGIFDLSLNGDDGLELLKIIKGKIPGMKCILMTAYTLDEIADNEIPPYINIINKPFDVNEIKVLVEKMI